MTCECNAYSDLAGQGALNKRGHDTRKIIRFLEIVAKHHEGKHELYKCSTCNQYWQKSPAWNRGYKAYLFKIPDISIESWQEKPFVPPDVLFDRCDRFQEYLKGSRFKEQSAICRHPGCREHAIKLSVLCLFHHMQNIGINPCFTEDYRWFGPYQRKDFELDVEQLKSIPNYHSL